MFCQQCGSEISEENKFCSQCGFSLEESKKYLTPRSAGSENRQPSDDREQISENTQTVILSDIPVSNAPVPDTYYDENENAVEPIFTSEIAEKIKIKQMKTVPSVILCVLFGLLSFIMLLSAELLITARQALSSGSVSAAVAGSDPSDIKVGAYVKTDAMKEILEEADIAPEDLDDDITLSEFIPLLFKDAEIDPEQLDEFFKNSDIMSIFSPLTANYEGYLLTGESTNEISVKVIMNALKSRRRDIRSYLGIDIQKYDVSIEDGLKSVKSEIDGLNAENALGGIGGYLHLALSPAAIAVLLVLAIGFSALIISTTKRVKPAVLTLGICSLIAGAAVAAVCLLNSVLVSALLPIDKSIVKFLSDILNNAFFNFALKLSLIFVGAGILLIAVRIIIKAAERSKAKKNHNGAKPSTV